MADMDGLDTLSAPRDDSIRAELRTHPFFSVAYIPQRARQYLGVLLFFPFAIPIVRALGLPSGVIELIQWSMFAATVFLIHEWVSLRTDSTISALVDRWPRLSRLDAPRPRSLFDTFANLLFAIPMFASGQVGDYPQFLWIIVFAFFIPWHLIFITTNTDDVFPSLSRTVTGISPLTINRYYHRPATRPRALVWITTLGGLFLLWNHVLGYLVPGYSFSHLTIGTLLLFALCIVASLFAIFALIGAVTIARSSPRPPWSWLVVIDAVRIGWAISYPELTSLSGLVRGYATTVLSIVYSALILWGATVFYRVVDTSPQFNIALIASWILVSLLLLVPELLDTECRSCTTPLSRSRTTPTSSPTNSAHPIPNDDTRPARLRPTLSSTLWLRPLLVRPTFE